MIRPSIAVIVSGFPRRSETFAIQELTALQRQGILTAIFATKAGEPGTHQPGVTRLMSQLTVLEEGTVAAQAQEIAARLGGRRITGIHGYFAHTPAEVAWRAAAHLGVPFGFSVHARDARKVPPRDLHRRGKAAACVIACNSDVAADLEGVGVQPVVIPHGVDLARFQPTPRRPAPPLRVLAVGRLVEKKGFGFLLEAAARLRVRFSLRIVGEGPLRGSLEQQCHRLGLTHSVSLCGAVTHGTLPAEYRAAHVVVVPSVVDRTGDRDGLPNVLLEAMASGCAVVATRVGAIPSVLDRARVGLLVPPRDPAPLSQAIERVAHAPGWGRGLGHNARTYVENNFGPDRTSDRLCTALETAYA